jgi:succinyl-diaminopimelate desuccinylase
MLVAARILTEHFEAELKRTGLTVMLVADEEVGGYEGARWLLRNDYCQTQSCIIGEPSYWSENGPRVVIGERGIAWFRLAAAGKPAHASMPPLGDNAIVKTLRALEMIQRLADVVRKPPTTIGSASTQGKKIMMRLAQLSGANSKLMKDTIDHYTVNIGVIQGGTKTNVVPDDCQAEIDVRIPVGGSLSEAKKLVRTFVSDGIKTELFNRSEPSYSPQDSRVVRATLSSAQSVLKGKVPAALVPYTSDAHWFREVLGVHTCTFGPGYVYHVYNEFVPIKQLVQSSAIYALAALALRR